MIILGLGSNIGEREAMLDAACEALSRVLRNMRRSSRIETPAMLKAGAPPEWDMPFLNMAVAGECDLPPEALLAHIKMLERQLGRQERGVWAPREIDIDILAYDDVIMSGALTLPHPGLPSRRFALAPFAELAPDWRWPAGGLHCGKTAQELLALL